MKAENIKLGMFVQNKDNGRVGVVTQLVDADGYVGVWYNALVGRWYEQPSNLRKVGEEDPTVTCEEFKEIYKDLLRG